MSDEDLVKRLRCFNLTDFDPWIILDEAADYIEHCHASHDAMAQEIERLTRERDEWKGTAEHLLDIEREWIAAAIRALAKQKPGI